MHKPKVVMRKLVDQDAANAATAITADADAANANANTNAATPATPPEGGAQARHQHRGGASTCPQLWGQERRRQGAGFQKRCWQGLRLIPIKLVCLNLNRRDTRQQPVPASRPASRANQKAGSKRIYQCTYPVQQCLYIS